MIKRHLIHASQKYKISKKKGAASKALFFTSIILTSYHMRLYFRPSLGLVFLILTCLQVFGLYIFLKGFLLTRQIFDLSGHAYSSWDRFPLHHPPSTTSTQQLRTPAPIKSKPAFKRTILILIDALRFDFVLNNNKSNNVQKYYLNQFPIIQHLHDTQPSSSLLFQFRADPPTTTMQRIKGLMTGSLPTFIDAGANFASSAVGEDHLLKHIKTKFEKMYFMGDDTWVNLFPDTFDDPDRTFDSDSFKMLDLDSVDNGILSHLWPLMEEQGKEDWEVTIAHFLGVDHCGHTYGPSDPNMKRKLNQMNGVIERLLPHVDNETLLLVMGDHGMSVEGDHGGESVEELMSTLFMYSGRKLTLDENYYHQFYNRIHQARSTRLGYDLPTISERLGYDATKYPVVAQIHLVPTLAYLLNVPIPFGNLGAIVPDVLYPVNDENQVTNLLHMVEQFRMNALQVYDYLNQYSLQTHQLDFSKEKLSPITQHLYNAEKIMMKLMQQEEFIRTIESSSTTSAKQQFNLYGKQLEDVIMEYDAFLISTIKYCEAIWAQFDTGCMFIGIILLGLSTLTSFWLTRKDLKATYKGILSVALPIFLLGLSMVYLRYHVFFQFLLTKGWFEKMEKLDWIGASAAFSICCVSLFAIQGRSVAQNDVFWYACDWYLVLVADIAQSFTLGSNSFVIWEDRGTRYVLATLSVCWTLRNLKEQVSKKSVIYPALFMILVCVTTLTGQCREEQFPDCNYVHNGLLEFGYSTTGFLTAGFIAASLWMVYYFSQLLQRKLNNGWIVKMYQVSALIVVIKIVQEVYLKNAVVGKTELMMVITKYLDVYLPRVVYGLCLTGTLICIYQRFVSKRKNKEVTSIGWSILLLWSTVLAIVQRPFAAIIVLGSPLFINLLTRGAFSSLLIRMTILHFLGNHLFFVTGHQATFTSLPWKAAFVGFDEMNYYGGMILVTLSTTAGYIISWIGWFIVLTDATSKYTSSGAAIRHPLHLLTLLQSIPTFLCAIFILILRRHLMTWKIFAPRFLVQILLEVGSHFAAIILEKAL